MDSTSSSSHRPAGRPGERVIGPCQRRRRRCARPSCCTRAAPLTSSLDPASVTFVLGLFHVTGLRHGPTSKAVVTDWKVPSMDPPHIHTLSLILPPPAPSPPLPFSSLGVLKLRGSSVLPATQHPTPPPASLSLAPRQHGHTQPRSLLAVAVPRSQHRPAAP